ncbi:MAG: hypothetical protein ACREJB_15720, partial [Planctomycetaceae bacterium]
MTVSTRPARIRRCYAIVRDALLAERNEHGWWTGELSTSPLSTATAVMALEMVRRDRLRIADCGLRSTDDATQHSALSTTHSAPSSTPHSELR